MPGQRKGKQPRRLRGRCEDICVSHMQAQRVCAHRNEPGCMHWHKCVWVHVSFLMQVHLYALFKTQYVCMSFLLFSPKSQMKPNLVSCLLYVSESEWESQLALLAKYECTHKEFDSGSNTALSVLTAKEKRHTAKRGQKDKKTKHWTILEKKNNINKEWWDNKQPIQWNVECVCTS